MLYLCVLHKVYKIKNKHNTILNSQQITYVSENQLKRNVFIFQI